MVLLHNLVQALRMRQIEWAQNQRIQHTQHDDIRADAESQRQDRGQREAGRVAHLPQRVVNIPADTRQQR